jgi:FkbM family methyltransferase
MGARQLVHSILNGMGFYVTRSRPLPGQLKYFFATEGINLVIDVGAFHGSYCTLLREEVGYRGPIVSFEPCAESFLKLSAHMACDPNWRGFPFGLSDTNTMATLNTYGIRGDFNSVLHLRQEGAATYRVDPTIVSAEMIQLKRLGSELINFSV